MRIDVSIHYWYVNIRNWEHIDKHLMELILQPGAIKPLQRAQ